MALLVQGFEVTLTVQDNGKGKSTLKYLCDPALVVTFADAQAARDSAVSALNDIIQGVITGTSVKEIQYEDAIVYPVSNIEIENKGSVTLALFASNRKGNLQIPTVSPAIFNGTSGSSADQIDVEDSFLVTYVDLFRNTTGVFFISRNQKVANSPNNNGIVVGKRISAQNNNG